MKKSIYVASIIEGGNVHLISLDKIEREVAQASQ